MCALLNLLPPGSSSPLQRDTLLTALSALVAEQCSPVSKSGAALVRTQGKPRGRHQEDWEDGELSAEGKQVSPDSLMGSRGDGSGQCSQKEKKRSTLGEKAIGWGTDKNEVPTMCQRTHSILYRLAFSPESQWAAGGGQLKGKNLSRKFCATDYALRNGKTFWGPGGYALLRLKTPPPFSSLLKFEINSKLPDSIRPYLVHIPCNR